ncbi:hypothetical protein BASA50_000678 [Batrachochytrium salamandrivorans]|uniref:Uncharacterized protein n=1 Tax=Batrachochytrium salamandrivorans TaxID=1357716 RepID=A0ABQ8EWB6_9FUNG|nr:hypothetical protein BASA62_004901 [Batrachochytrium salamandrivorans]KAH6573164.1 hypothetical protein BASA60_006178 [Batrachochytrium salamandrivorans]KAH6586213.1 hypothetical protein BASA50_000678 [Batrachochytrium salamandrivorans]
MALTNLSDMPPSSQIHDTYNQHVISAAVTIQRHIRGRQARQRISHLRYCATTIQRIYRGHRARTTMIKRYPMGLARHIEAYQSSASQRTQAAIRWNEQRYALLQGTHPSRVHVECSIEIQRAATRLQKWWRGVQGRQYYRRIRNQANSQTSLQVHIPESPQNTSSGIYSDVSERPKGGLRDAKSCKLAADAVQTIIGKLQQINDNQSSLASIRKKCTLLDSELKAYHQRSDKSKKQPSNSASEMSEPSALNTCRMKRERIDAMCKRFQAIGPGWQGANVILKHPIQADIAARWRPAHLEALRVSKQPWWLRVPEPMLTSRSQKPASQDMHEWISEIKEELNPCGRIF